MLESYLIALLFLTLILLLTGFPVAFTLAGSSLIMAGVGTVTGEFDDAFLSALPERIFGIMQNQSLLAIPLFVLMGVILERSKISEELLEVMGELFSPIKGGLGISVCLVGGLLAASTGIVGATVVTMGLISLPTMLNQKYSPSLSTGIICASGTLGQIIPPSIVLIILGDIMSSAHQQAQLEQGIFSPTSISVADLFVGAIFPGLLLMVCYMVFVFLVAIFRPSVAPQLPAEKRPKVLSAKFFSRLIRVMLPPLLLILGVLGTILAGIATPTEAASVGVVGATLLAYLKKQISKQVLHQACINTTQVTVMVFSILIGASLFSLVFRGFEGDEIVQSFLTSMDGGLVASFLFVMILMFIMGFFLDFFEICFVVVPVVGPILLNMGLDPVWLGVMIAMNLQTSFLTPPFGFSLFYLRGVTPEAVTTKQMYIGVLPFIAIQVCVLVLLWFYPEIVTWLPNKVFS